MRKSAIDTAHLFQRLISQSAFYRLLVFFLFIGFLKAIFLQMDYVFPKFGIRELGLQCACRENFRHQRDYHYFPGAGRRRAHTKVCSVSDGGNRWSNLFCWGVHHGAADAMVPACRSAASSANGLGMVTLDCRGIFTLTTSCLRLYLAVFSIGEAFYSPRVYEYAAAIAPRGQEASYGSLAYLPFLVGKILVGTGGWLLAAFVPEHGPRRPATMWLDLCSGGIGRADRVDFAASLHSRPGSRAARLIGKMA